MWSNITSVNTKAAEGYKIWLVLTPRGVVGSSALKKHGSEWQAKTCSPSRMSSLRLRVQWIFIGTVSSWTASDFGRHETKLIVGFFIFFVMFFHAGWFVMICAPFWFLQFFSFLFIFSHSRLPGSTRAVAVIGCVQVEAPEPPKAPEVPKVPELPKAQKGIRVGKTTMMDLCGLLIPLKERALYIFWRLLNVRWMQIEPYFAKCGQKTRGHRKAAGGYTILLVLTPWGVVGCSALNKNGSEWEAETCLHLEWVC